MAAKIKNMGSFLKLLTGGAIGITLAPFGIYLDEKYFQVKKSKREFTINHEQIHWQQQLELLIIFFYLLYVLEFIIKIFINGKKAYMSLSFEREAYDNDNNLEYLKTRKRYSWIKRIIR